MNRRSVLIEKMNLLEAQGLSCSGCSGVCCTYQANSMLMTPLEALELFEYLKINKMLTLDLKQKLENAVTQYRLEPKYDNMRRSYLRKTYTCPFFNHKEFGCPLPREVKPYGCLAFNSHHPEKKASEDCYSEIDLLELREKNNSEETLLNLEIKKKFNLIWEKSPIPNAILEIWNLTSDADLLQD
jgi:hypothetical protein